MQYDQRWSLTAPLKRAKSLEKINISDSSAIGFLRSLFAQPYPQDENVSDQIIIVGRFGLILALLVLPFSLGICTYFEPGLRDVYIKAHLSFYLPSNLLAIFVAQTGRLRALLRANNILFIGVACCWIYSIEGNPGYEATLNYYMHLPLTAMLFVQNIVVFSLAPRQSAVSGILFFLFLMIYPALRDENGYHNQQFAFVVFAIVYLTMLIFTISIHMILRTMNENLAKSKNAIDEIARSRDLLQTTLESSKIGIYGFNARGQLILSKNVDDIFSDKIRISDRAEFELDLGRDYNIYFHENDQKAAEFSVDERDFMIIQRQAPSLLIYAVIDITERNQWRKQLLESEKLSLIGQMTSGIAHDYNNILAIAMNNIEAFPEEEYQDLWENYIEPVQNALEHARSVSHKLLTLSSHKTEDMQMVDLGKFLNEVTPIFRSALEEEVHLWVDQPRGIVVRSMPEELSAAILNLVLNARNAINHQNGEISIKVSVLKNYCKLSIADNGAGIPKHIQDSIFDPFFTTKKSEYSSGLGLLSVKTFMMQSGGKISFESRPGHTVFHLYLPIIEACTETITPRRKIQIANTRMPTPRKILLVDDNEKILISMKRVFDTHNVECITASNAQQAMTAAMMHLDIDVAFIDLSMPDMNGLKLGTELMRIKPDARYFILTGNASKETIRQAREQGFVDVLLKPLKIQTLIDLAVESMMH